MCYLKWCLAKTEWEMIWIELGFHILNSTQTQNSPKLDPFYPTLPYCKFIFLQTLNFPLLTLTFYNFLCFNILFCFWYCKFRRILQISVNFSSFLHRPPRPTFTIFTEMSYQQRALDPEMVRVAIKSEVCCGEGEVDWKLNKQQLK